jgi:hypothetical protein
MMDWLKFRGYKKMISINITAFYMRDNHTFKKLNINDMNEFLNEIKEEHMSGFTRGMVGSTHSCAPRPIHNKGDIELFLLLSREWLEEFMEKLSRQFTTGAHGSDIIIFKG